VPPGAAPGLGPALTDPSPGAKKEVQEVDKKLPLYEYQCPQDGTFELVRKFSDPPLAACPTCGGPIEKLFSAPAIQFKGTGWYITDYARKPTGGEAAGKKDGDSKDASGKDTGGKDTGGKDTGGKDTGGKDTGSSDASKAASSGSSSTDSKASRSSKDSDKK